MPGSHVPGRGEHRAERRLQLIALELEVVADHCLRVLERLPTLEELLL
jgi:hypothetical protein